MRLERHLYNYTGTLISLNQPLQPVNAQVITINCHKRLLWMTWISVSDLLIPFEVSVGHDIGGALQWVCRLSAVPTK